MFRYVVKSEAARGESPSSMTATIAFAPLRRYGVRPVTLLKVRRRKTATSPRRRAERCDAGIGDQRQARRLARYLRAYRARLVLRLPRAEAAGGRFDDPPAELHAALVKTTMRGTAILNDAVTGAAPLTFEAVPFR